MLLLKSNNINLINSALHTHNYLQYSQNSCKAGFRRLIIKMIKWKQCHLLIDKKNTWFQAFNSMMLSVSIPQYLRLQNKPLLRLVNQHKYNQHKVIRFQGQCASKTFGKVERVYIDEPLLDF